MEDRTLPDAIRKRVMGKHFTCDEVGQSGAQVRCYPDMVLKVQHTGEESDREYEMMRWLRGKVPVPEVLAFERAEGYNYLLMSRLPGEMACADRYLKAPEELMRLLAQGLKMLWQVDIHGGMAGDTLDRKLRRARERVESGCCDTSDAEPDTYGPSGFRSPAELLIWLEQNRPEEEIVLSHGDYCLPNIFLSGGKVTGFIDLGHCGVADRFQDIALCCRSLRHNLEEIAHRPFDEASFFRELGVERDAEKIRYYILLDELF